MAGAAETATAGGGARPRTGAPHPLGSTRARLKSRDLVRLAEEKGYSALQ